MTFALQAMVSLTETDDGTVLLDERRGRYFQLNASGGRVLRALLDGGTVEAAVAELTGRYAVSTEEAARDVTALVRDLRTAALIVSGPPGAPS